MLYATSYSIYLILSILLVTSIIVFSLKRNLVYLHIFQQQEYDNYRMFTWIINNRAIDKRLSIALFLIFCINLLIFYKFIFFTNFIKFIISCILIIIPIGGFAYLEKNPIKFAKKPLVLTDRAKRIYYLALCFNFVNALIILFNINLKNYLIQLLLIIHLIPVYLIIANICLIPIENYIQKKYWKLAIAQLSKCKPLIVGITGSFGKTTVKHFLGHILQQADHTLITSGSINTPMGITKVIIEELNTSHKYFIVEMGAYGVGSINKICQLTPPALGIITAIGSAHYERFKDLENVAKAKFELAEAVIKNSQSLDNFNDFNNSKNSATRVIINEQVLNTNYAKKYLEEHKSFIQILDPNSISNVVQLKTGLTWDLKIDGVNQQIVTQIFGSHNVANLSLACLAAYNLKVPMPIIINALKTMPQVNHRLEIKQQNNYTIIDDAYNANPEGFKSGLELLNFLHTSNNKGIKLTQGSQSAQETLLSQSAQDTPVSQSVQETPLSQSAQETQGSQSAQETLLVEGRKILVTPGLIELGSKHEEEHFNLGLLAAKYVDLALIVNPSRITSFLAGFKQNSNADQLLISLESWEQAKNWLNINCKANDVVLIANDLPDLYETKLQI